MTNTLIGGDTTLTVPTGTVEALTGLNVSVSGLGSAEVGLDAAGDLVADFPITGGYEGVYDVILHQGSGLSFSDSHGFIDISDLRIDTRTDVVYGDVSLQTGSTTINESDVDLFNIGTGDKLTFTNDALSAVNLALGSNLSPSVQVGTATPHPISNPLPVSIEEAPLVQGVLGLLGHHGGTEPIVGGQTDVTLTSASTLESLGLSVSTLGSARIENSGANPVAEFAITGGTETAAGDVILHEGSGLALSKGADTVALQNFIVDTIHDVVDADVTIDGHFAGDLAVFNLGAGGKLTLTSAAANALDQTFNLGSTLSASTEIGIAAPHPFALTHPEAQLLSALVGIPEHPAVL
jgi:hypothetical protein